MAPLLMLYIKRAGTLMQAVSEPISGWRDQQLHTRKWKWDCGEPGSWWC
jgi:hypothetical protein